MHSWLTALCHALLPSISCAQPPSISELQQLYRDAKIKFDSDEAFKQRAYEEVVRLQSGEQDSLDGESMHCICICNGVFACLAVSTAYHFVTVVRCTYFDHVCQRGSSSVRSVAQISAQSINGWTSSYKRCKHQHASLRRQDTKRCKAS